MRLSGWGKGVALAVFVLADVVLIYLALRPADAGVTSTTSSFPSATAAPSPTETSTETSTSQPTTEAAPVPAASERVLLSIGSAGAGARAVAGSCDESGAALSLRSAGGDLKSVDVPATSLLRVKSVNAEETWVIGTDKSCAPRFVRTLDGGKTWDVKSSTIGVLHLMPPADRAVHSPDGKAPSPCRKASATVDLSVYGTTQAALLCAEGEVRVTSDDGATWKRVGAATGATAISYVNNRTAYAAAPGASDCDGAAILRSRDGGTSWKPVGCASLDAAAVGLSFSSAADGALASAEKVLVTSDGGKTWSPDQG